MKQFLNKQCKIHISVNGESLFFTVKKVIDVSDSHISFIDRYNKLWCFDKNQVKQINE